MFEEQISDVFVVDCSGNEPRRNAGQIIYRWWNSFLHVGIGVTLLLLCSQQALAQASEEERWIARLVSVEGTVEGRRAQQADWSPATLNDEFEVGDAVRVQAFGRAAIRLPDETVLRLDQNTTIYFSEPEDEKRSWLELLRGVIHMISREPGAIKVNTTFATLGLKGTEFLVMVTPQETTVTVFEGAVAVSNAAGEVNILSGQSATARTGRLPVVQVAVRPRDAVQWTLYYPPILGYEVLAADQEPAPAQINDPRFYTGRASQRLAVGSIDEAREDISKALSIDASNVDALVLQSIIALTQNDKIKALQLANRAVAQDPQSAAALIAFSYAQQAHFDISGALATLQNAVDRNPANALAWSRLSELWLAVGYLDKAEDAAEMAVSINPRVAHTQSVLGFALLTQIKIGQAIAAFEKAIGFDKAAPLPHLGLGLAHIRKGNLAAGREEIEIAVILDPGNALIRSYMGKAYYEEKRDELAESQYEIAKELDPLDPTPWLYDAIRKQSINKPVEALGDLKKSIELNDNRAIYRSQLQLDEDLAVRGASLARVYDNLGFEQLAVVEGIKSIGIDPANHSAHRFLSDAYAAQPRHEIAQASELLQSQLLQPININPVLPRIPETDLNILSGVGPARTAFNDFTPLFEGNGIRLNLTGGVGNNDTLGDELVVSGIANRVSYSIGQFHYETDGFRPNNDLEHDIYNLFVQAQLTDRLDVQFEYRSRESDQGDLRLNFDPNDFSMFNRRQIEQKTPRLGLHFAPSPRSDLIVSLIHTDRTENLHQVGATGATVDADLDSKGDDVQAQYLFRADLFNVTAGIGSSDIESHKSEVVDIAGALPGGVCPPPFVPPFFGVCVISSNTDPTTQQANAYVYTNVTWPTDMIWTLGLSHDAVEEGPLDVNKFNPKLGLQWNFTDSARLRMAYFETVKRTLIVDQTLEPTQIAGFNQFFDDFNGTKAERYGIGLDATLRSDLYGGVELSKRELEITPINFVTGKITFEDQQETLDRAYLYWTPLPKWAVRAEYQHERFERIDTRGSSLPTLVDTTIVPVFLSYFHGTGRAAGLFAEIGANFVRQKVDLAATSTFGEDRDDFISVDAAIGWRLRQRRGLLSLEVRNLFDEKFLYQDMNIQNPVPSNPRFIPDRTVIGRLTLSF